MLHESAKTHATFDAERVVAYGGPGPIMRSAWENRRPSTSPPHTKIDAARALAWGGLDAPADWARVRRRFRDGHTETWWAADARLRSWQNDPTGRAGTRRHG
ncbi:hypothetical protein [Streptosporangium sp. NPDC002607]